MNDEFQMSNDEGMTKHETRSKIGWRCSPGFVICHSSFLRHFVLILAVLNLSAAEVPKLNEQRDDGSIVLLATNAATHGAQIRYEPQPHKNTIGYWTKVEDWVSWDFLVTKPGTFSVTLTQSCGKGSGGSEVAFGLREQAIIDVVPETGSFTSWTNRVIGTFLVRTAGVHTITVKPLKKPGLAVMDLRAITLTPETKKGAE
ncbi:MAG TPA: hypothetical protein VK530_19620 [Candidatus Acidoferrum sp.]|nr:hypothetical protein [Candidatus Acidoferrum sp.]